MNLTPQAIALVFYLGPPAKKFEVKGFVYLLSLAIDGHVQELVAHGHQRTEISSGMLNQRLAQSIGSFRNEKVNNVSQS